MMSQTPIRVLLDQNRNYSIHINRYQLSQFNSLIAPLNIGKNIGLIYTDSTQLYAEKIQHSFDQTSYNVFTFNVTDGESAKSWNTLKKLLNQIFEWNFERHDTLIAVGGGVIGDLTGFAASIYLRGIPIIQVPTTLLAQVDAAIGGKTGINHEKGKNLIGAFHHPQMVVIDIETLRTLPSREIRSGLAEVIKYGVIMDPALFQLLENHHETLSLLDITKNVTLWESIIIASCRNKSIIVSQDEKEAGERMKLNFGHTIGHAIEAVYGYDTYTHGECVALGMKAAIHISVQRQLMNQSDSQRVSQLLTSLGFPQHIKRQDPQIFLNHMRHDKKIKNGKIRFILPLKIGVVDCVDNVTEDEIITALSVIMS